MTSEQLPRGSPAIVEDPQEPLNADAAEVPVPTVVGEPAVVVPPVLVGAVGLSSSALFSNAQPDASEEASSKVRNEMCFIVALTVLYRHAHFWRVPKMNSPEVSGNPGSS